MKQSCREKDIPYGAFKNHKYMDRLSVILDSDNSYVCIRGLTLLAYNAKWDKDYKIDEIIDKYLKHITDVKLRQGDLSNYYRLRQSIRTN